jgi:hypothetical protein
LVAAALLPAIREAIKQNEIGNASPYELSYARLGVSGASFGLFQGDTNVSHVARATLADALTANGADDATVTRILGLVSRACPNGNPLSAADTALANAALSSAGGRGLVDRMDDQLLAVVLGEVDTCTAAAVAHKLSIDPTALLYIALWVNMTGPPATLASWLSGNTELGLSSPAGPIVTRQNIESYLHSSKFFMIHPKNFVHMQQSVVAAIPLLPAASA